MNIDPHSKPHACFVLPYFYYFLFPTLQLPYLKYKFNYLGNEGFYGGRRANPATNLLIKSNATAGGRPQTQLGTRYGWPLAHKEELLRPLTGVVFNPAGCPYPNTVLTKKPGGRDGFVADNPTMEQVRTGLHDTCRKSQI